MRITRVDCHVLLVPDYDADACSSAQDDLVVEIHTDEGLVGIGETDTNPWVARECIKARGTHSMGRGIEEMLLGADPLDPDAIWRTLYSGSKMTGRRGAVICALGALDMALWDIAGQAAGKSVARLLGAPPGAQVTPYASLLPEGDTVEEYAASLMDKLQKARSIGFRAAKLEVCINGPYSHGGLQADDRHVVEIVAAARRSVGPGYPLMLDVAYAWPSARHALELLEKLAEYDLYFCETPIDIDDLEGYAFLHEHSPIPIAAGEWQNTHHEFRDLADRGKVDILQPDIGRVGGFGEARRVADLAAQRGLRIVPHCWKTGIGIAASVHLAAANGGVCPYVEYLPKELAESRLRKELLAREFEVAEGVIRVPDTPGLGVAIDRVALERFRGRDAV